ncbi:MAG TPA: hypothetical protein DCW29_01795 [Janthinobacterium sp.]|nr:hypothetical protein [Janthinobacterium sp.]
MQRFFIPFALACALAPVSGRAASLTLDCPGSERTDAPAIKAQAKAVLRKSPLKLMVFAGGKWMAFIDTPGEELEGVFYTYCDHSDGYFLLRKADGDMSGILIDEKTGAIMPGGQKVLFSPDRHAYLATEQPDGLDGEFWQVYALDGRISWGGMILFADRSAARPLPI